MGSHVSRAKWHAYSETATRSLILADTTRADVLFRLQHVVSRRHYQYSIGTSLHCTLDLVEVKRQRPIDILLLTSETHSIWMRQQCDKHGSRCRCSDTTKSKSLTSLSHLRARPSLSNPTHRSDMLNKRQREGDVRRDDTDLPDLNRKVNSFQDHSLGSLRQSCLKAMRRQRVFASGTRILHQGQSSQRRLRWGRVSPHTRPTQMYVESSVFPSRFGQPLTSSPSSLVQSRYSCSFLPRATRASNGYSPETCCMYQPSSMRCRRCAQSRRRAWTSYAVCWMSTTAGLRQQRGVRNKR